MMPIEGPDNPDQPGAMPSTIALDQAPYLTSSIPGTGGRIKERESDFLVEEIPLYDPVGEGEHLYLMIEKTGIATHQLIDLLTRHFGVRPSAIGYAGMKDKRAITRQVVSIHVPGRRPEDFPMIREHGIQVLWADLHVNKLRRGHLRGNRFAVIIRGCEPTRVLDAERVLRALMTQGMPNYFGHQRFGARLNNHVLGKFYLTRRHRDVLDTLLGPSTAPGDRNTEARQAYAEARFADALALTPPSQRAEREALRALARGARPSECVNAVNEMQRRFWMTAFQSAIFNRVCARRVISGDMDRFIDGDIAARHTASGLFRVDELTRKDPLTAERLRRIDISPTGPLWGAEMMEASGAAGALEREELEREAVPRESLQWAAKTFGKHLAGSRRPLRVPVIDPRVEGGVDAHGAYIRCAFELPAGSFATMVMREVMKVFALEGEQDIHDHEHDEDDDRA